MHPPGSAVCVLLPSNEGQRLNPLYNNHYNNLVFIYFFLFLFFLLFFSFHCDKLDMYMCLFFPFFIFINLYVCIIYLLLWQHCEIYTVMPIKLI